MTLDQLRYFVAAAKFENMGRAANAVAISPSVISHSIANLENELGVLLFRRAGKRVSLTVQGKELSLKAERILHEVEALRKGEDKPSTLSGQYRLAASHVLAARVLTSAWSKVQKNNPDLIGEIGAAETKSILGDLLASRIDFGLCFSPVRHPDLTVVDLYQGRQILVVRKGHPFVQRKNPGKLTELSNFPAVLHRVTEAHAIERDFPVLEEHGIRARTTLLYDHGDIAVEKLIDSDSWSLIPEIVFDFHKNRLEKIPLPKSWKCPILIAAIHSRHKTGDRALTALIDFLKDRFTRI